MRRLTAQEHQSGFMVPASSEPACVLTLQLINNLGRAQFSSSGGVESRLSAALKILLLTLETADQGSAGPGAGLWRPGATVQLQDQQMAPY